MFDRYSIGTSNEKLQEEFRIDVPENYAPCFNAGPTKLLPVITNESPQGVSFFYWGLPPSMAKNKSISQKLIIAPVSDLETKTSYSKGLQSHRCVAIADGLFFWKQTSKKKKVPYHFARPGRTPFLIAGMWDEFEMTNGEINHTFIVITSVEEEVDYYKMHKPMLIDKGNLGQWLGPNMAANNAIGLLETIEFSEWGAFPVSSLINNINIDSPQLIQATDPMDQFGNYSLFD